MTPEDLRQTFERLARGPVAATEAGRHLYLWHGALAAIETLIPPALLQYLDLYAVAGQLSRTPYAMDEARRLLRAQLERDLRSQESRARQQVLVVRGCGLLARYRVPLQPFYSFVSDRRAVLLVVLREDSEFVPSAALPGIVRLTASATFEALSRAVGEKNVIQGG